ncbi:hypothetical protein E2320_019423, partial [Naja naja]
MQPTQQNSLHYVFKSRKIYPIFDRQWHKIGISVQSRKISLYVDCNLIEQRMTEKKARPDIQGKILIATHYLDGKPIDVSVHVHIELGRMILYCDPSLAAQENCCELSEHVHPLEKNLKTTAASPSVGHIGKIQALPIMGKNPEEKCFCSQNK